ncbi:MAG: hypothetical protein AAF619_06290 [Pseudomonadota bacterium]
MLVRHLRFVAAAVGAVFILKAVDIATNGEFDLGIPSSAVAQEEATDDAAADGDAEATADGELMPANQVDLASPPTNDAMLESERAVLERLAERRTALEEREGALEMRERLLEAAEQRLDTRLSELRAIEERLQQRAEDEQTRKKATLEGIVTMYENMKAKDAAEIFNTLDMGILVEVVENMNPRNMSAVLAAMNADSAQRLTLALAQRAREQDVNPLDELELVGNGG